MDTIFILNGPSSLKLTPIGIDPVLLQQLEMLFAFYHKQWWCQRQMFYHYKKCNAIFNGLALLIMACGMVVGPVLQNGIIATAITALGVVVKGWNEFKKFSFKVDMCRFAYTSYLKSLSELRMYVRGKPMDELVNFLVKMQTIDDIVVDFTPPLADRFIKQYNARFHYVPQNNIKDSDSFHPPQSCLNVNVIQDQNHPPPKKNESDVVVNEEVCLEPC